MSAGNCMSIHEAARKNISKLRFAGELSHMFGLPLWANRDDHISIDIVDLAPGPWVSLWADLHTTLEEENPKKFLITMLGDLDARQWQPYEGTSS